MRAKDGQRLPMNAARRLLCRSTTQSRGPAARSRRDPARHFRGWSRDQGVNTPYALPIRHHQDRVEIELDHVGSELARELRSLDHHVPECSDVAARLAPISRKKPRDPQPTDGSINLVLVGWRGEDGHVLQGFGIDPACPNQ